LTAVHVHAARDPTHKKEQPTAREKREKEIGLLIEILDLSRRQQPRCCSLAERKNRLYRRRRINSHTPPIYYYCNFRSRSCSNHTKSISGLRSISELGDSKNSVPPVYIVPKNGQNAMQFSTKERRKMYV
jgi:hypothetical protein